jgi:C4-type Zn-finger protein
VKSDCMECKSFPKECCAPFFFSFVVQHVSNTKVTTLLLIIQIIPMASPGSSKGRKPPSPRKQVTISSDRISKPIGPVKRATSTTKTALGKRPVEDNPVGTLNSKKTFFGFTIPYLSDIFSPSAERDRERILEEESLLREVKRPRRRPSQPSLTPQEKPRRTADAIDAKFASIHAEKAEKLLNDNSRKLKWRPEINANHGDYIAQETLFTYLLSWQNRPVSSILKDHFEEAQILKITPAKEKGSISKVQEQETKEYHKLLSEGGAFYGRGDNLATKLTMLKFGFPVAPMTKTNVYNGGTDVLMDDPSDEEEHQARYEKIEYSEKPLEFLDSNSERSYGYPTLRRKSNHFPWKACLTYIGPRTDYQSYTGDDEENKADDASKAQHPEGKSRRPSQLSLKSKNSQPIFPDPKSPLLGLRGGGGSMEDVAPRRARSSSKRASPTKTSPAKAGPLKAILKWPSTEKANLTRSSPPKASLKKQVVIETKDDTADDTADEIPQNLIEQTESVEEEERVDGEDQVVEKDQAAQTGNEVTPTDPALRWSTQTRDPSFETQSQTNKRRLNRPRILEKRAASVPIQDPDSRRAEHRNLDRQQRESFTTDQTVIEPGGHPQPPVFGTSSDLVIGDWIDALPTVYASHITPTEISRLEKDRAKLRYQVLKRADGCSVCGEVFHSHEMIRRRAHLKKHTDAIASAGKCPICESDQWMMMDMDQRREHIAHHYKGSELGRGGNMFEQLNCPVCDKELSTIGDVDDILFHVAEHAPGVLKYCDRCGLNMKEGSESELIQHKKVCVNAPERFPGDRNLIFCDICGKDRTVENEKQRVDHRRFCISGKGAFCRKCGFNMSHLDSAGQHRHMERCRDIGRHRKKFCRKCGRDVSQMNDEEKAQHRDTCQLKEPPPVTEKLSGMGEAFLFSSVAVANMVY